MKLKKSRLFYKTFGYSMLVMTLLVFLAHTLIYFVMQNEYMRQKQVEADGLINMMSQTFSQNEEETILKLAENFSSFYNVNLSVQIGEQEFIYNGFTPVEIKIDQQQGDLFLIKEDESKPVSTLVVQRTFTNIENKVCRLQLTLNMKVVEEASQITFKILPYSITASLIVSFILSLFYSVMITRPIYRLVEITKDMEEMKPGVYVPCVRKDELGLLGESINSLYETLLQTIELLKKESQHRKEEDQQRIDFLRSASHEMKTPLASMLIVLENMQYNIGEYKDHDHYLQVCQQQVQYLSNMVQNILDASHMQMLVVEEPKEISASVVLYKVLDSYRIIARAKQLVLIEQLHEDAKDFTVSINEQNLEKVFSNLLHNALNYTKSGHIITIYADSNMIYIENECEPLNEEILSHIFEAFYRGNHQEVEGNGLGLYIVSQILEHSQIHYYFESYEKGMRFTLKK